MHPFWSHGTRQPLGLMSWFHLLYLQMNPYLQLPNQSSSNYQTSPLTEKPAQEIHHSKHTKGFNTPSFLCYFLSIIYASIKNISFTFRLVEYRWVHTSSIKLSDVLISEDYIFPTFWEQRICINHAGIIKMTNDKIREDKCKKKKKCGNYGGNCWRKRGYEGETLFILIRES